MDNEKQAPVIPAGTEPTVFGTPTFPGGAPGQAEQPPATNQEGAQQVAQQDSGKAPGEGTTFTELAAKKGFKTPDDLAKAYANLESQNTRVEMGLSELMSIRGQSQPGEAEDLAGVDQEIQTQEQALKVVEKVVRRFTRPLEDKIALQELFFKHPDATQYAAEIGKAIKDNPGITWESAYKVAKFDASQDTAREQGRQEAYQTIDKKQAAAVQPTRPAEQGPNLRDLIVDRNTPWSEVQRIMKERFAQR